MNRPELLSPAGSAPAMVAAVQCGADAVYLGAGDFNARKGADNFGGELDAAMCYCHARGAKVYLTLNTMVREDELGRLEGTVEEICRAGADGVIVQDFGVARAVHQMAPALALHASTQMAVHNPQGVDFLVENGFRRVVLAREMTYEEIARCAGRGAELEVFVHGALCVACSGQCLLSSMIGGRSGNRGLCAQPCRMKYRLGDREGYLLSTKDLCGLEGLPALIQAGADSLKIEGRLKRAEYVALTTRIYRVALDGPAFDLASARAELAQMFNRGGFTRGYGFGVEDAELMYPERPNHLGAPIGRCKIDGKLHLTRAVDGRDALVLRRAGREDIPARLGDCAPGEVRFPEAKRGDALFRLVSQAQMQDARQSFAGEHRRFPVDARLHLVPGEPTRLELTDGAHEVVCAGEEVQTAKSRPADPARIRAQIEKLGDTPFVLRNWDARIDPAAHLSVSALNALRRQAVEALIQARAGSPIPCAPLKLPVQGKEAPASGARIEIIAQSADADILRRALAAGADRAVYAPEDLRPEALDTALRALPPAFDLALPPVAGEGALRALHAWAQANGRRIGRVYISNVGQLALRWPGTPVGDAALNVANNLSAAQLRDWGMEILTPSVELNCGQINELHGRRQLIVYGALALMNLRHCPLRATEKVPGRHSLCRRCDAASAGERINDQALVDRTGARFPLRRIASGEGCVIQLLNGAKLMLLRKSRALPACEGWRLLLDAQDDVENVVRLHCLAAQGADVRSDPAWAALADQNTTTGHYFRGAE